MRRPIDLYIRIRHSKPEQKPLAWFLDLEEGVSFGAMARGLVAHHRPWFL